MIKDALRQQFLAERKKLPPDILQSKNQAITAHFLQYFDLTQINNLHIFLPILQRNEINTYLIIQAIQQNYPHITIIVSKSNFHTCEMSHFVLTPTTVLIENKWHIPEPINGQSFPEKLIEMVLLPLICFDQQGFRVGYGKGFYDRFLARCTHKITKVGLSHFPPIDKIDDIHKLDVKMDFCVTTETVWTFQTEFQVSHF